MTIPYPGDTGGAGDTHGAEGQRPHHPVLLPGVQLVDVLVRHEDGPVPALTEAVDLQGQGQVKGHTRGVTQMWWPGRTSPLTLRTWQEKRTEPKCTLSLRAWRRWAKGSASPGFSVGCGESRRGVWVAPRGAGDTLGCTTGHPQTRRQPLPRRGNPVPSCAGSPSPSAAPPAPPWRPPWPGSAPSRRGGCS